MENVYILRKYVIEYLLTGDKSYLRDTICLLDTMYTGCPLTPEEINILKTRGKIAAIKAYVTRKRGNQGWPGNVSAFSLVEGKNDIEAAMKKLGID